MPRLFIIAAVIGAVMAVPYFSSRAPQSSADAKSGAPADAAAPNAAVTASAQTAATQLPALTSPNSLGPAQHPTIEQVLRFDIDKHWIYRRWARKSIWPTDVGLVGVRVQLVTGTRPGALAGSLTYYCNSHDQVEHISFHGRTGATAPLVAFLTRTYEFQPAAAPVGEQCYQVKRGRRVQSELRARPEAVITGTSPHGSFIVELELARPNSKRLLPPRGPHLNVPPATASTAPPASDDSKSSGLQSAVSSYFERGRYATPQEQGQVLWKRWPN